MKHTIKKLTFEVEEIRKGTDGMVEYVKFQYNFRIDNETLNVTVPASLNIFFGGRELTEELIARVFDDMRDTLIPYIMDFCIQGVKRDNRGGG